LTSVDAGAPITLLAGIHPGCYELVSTGQIRAIRDLKGKSVGVPSMVRVTTYFLRAWRRTWALIRERISIGSFTNRKTQWPCSPHTKWMRSWPLLLYPRSCAGRTLAV